jgi:hypothetical protein
MKIDILGMELEKGLPYWLSPEAKLSHKIADIRKKHRDKHLAKLAQDRALARDDYNPQEARVGKGEEGGGQWQSLGDNREQTACGPRRSFRQ